MTERASLGVLPSSLLRPDPFLYHPALLGSNHLSSFFSLLFSLFSRCCSLSVRRLARWSCGRRPCCCCRCSCCCCCCGCSCSFFLFQHQTEVDVGLLLFLLLLRLMFLLLLLLLLLFLLPLTCLFFWYLLLIFQHNYHRPSWAEPVLGSSRIGGVVDTAAAAALLRSHDGAAS